MTIPKAVVQAVADRADGHCEACGLFLFGIVALHHRKLRSQGGAHTVENLILIHERCHLGIHANPTRSYELGHMVRRRFDPASVSVTLLPGLCVLR